MNPCRAFARLACGLVLLATATGILAAPRTFGVLSQRSAVLTASYWNPILAWVSAKSGVALELRIAKPGGDSLKRGEFDFVYTNHNFLPENEPAGYRVILKPRGEGIRGEIVVPEDSPVRELAGLAGREVAFPSRSAFVAYAVTMQGLARAGVRVEPVFGANQEGAMAQMRSGRVAAASVNSQLMHDYAQREKLRYRVLWKSEAYPDLPISVHPRVGEREAAAVREALAAMAQDAEGARILAASAALVKEQPPYGFEASGDAEYAGVRAVYRAAAR